MTDPHTGAAPASGPARRLPARPRPGAPEPVRLEFVRPGSGQSGAVQSGSARPGPGMPGQSGHPGPALSGVDLARVALRAAKEQARQRGEQVRQKKQSRRQGLRSGARTGGRDPVSLAAALRQLIIERGWEAPAAIGGVMGRWPQIVGAEVAAHCLPEHYADASCELSVRCDSAVWATQLRLLAPQLVARLNAELGHGTVKLIKVHGPVGPVHRYGRLRAPGSRGPGDTWG